MNIFSLFSNAMSMTGKVDRAAYGVEPGETDELIAEPCDTGHPQLPDSDASPGDEIFDNGTLPTPS